MISWELSGREEKLTGPVLVRLPVEDSLSKARPIVSGAENSSYREVARAIEQASDPTGHPVGAELSGIELANLFKCNRVFERYAIALVAGAEFVNSSEEIGLSAEAEALGLHS